MTDPEPDQWVLLECDWNTNPECIVRSDSVRFKDLETLGWKNATSGDWICPVCWDGYNQVKGGYGIE